jgi:hypothetical protein
MSNPELMTMARWLATKAIKAQLRAAGIRPEHVEVRELHLAANAYFNAYRTELIEQSLSMGRARLLIHRMRKDHESKGPASMRWRTTHPFISFDGITGASI